jgi:hypothetical protein
MTGRLSPLERVLEALPPRLAGLFETGLVAIETVPAESMPCHACTVLRRGDFRFTIQVDEEVATMAPPAALRGIIRHEVGHIFLGHFGPDHQACSLPCNTLAEEAEVNHYLPEEELLAIEEAFTSLLLLRLARRGGPLLAQLAASLGAKSALVRPQAVSAMAGLAPDLPPLWRYLHPLLHPLERRQERQRQGCPFPIPEWGEGGQTAGDALDGAAEASPCGGVQVEEGALGEAMGVAAALATSPRGKEAAAELMPAPSSWGTDAAGSAISWQVPPLPAWAQEVMAWARRMVSREWRLVRTRRRPRIDILRATGMYIPDRGYERQRRRTRVAFAVDTSGSMARDLHYAHPAIRFLLNQGVEVHFLCGDVRVEVDVLLRPGDEIPQPRGGGGTDICPLVEAAVAHRPDGLVVYTDAAIPRWPEKPEGTTVLWVVPSGCTPPYGEVVVWQPLQ